MNEIINSPGRTPWTPVFEGDTYCSASCGGKCTYTSYVLACETAASLAAILGDGWRPNVWENLGWHWSVQNGECVLNQSTNGEGHIWGTLQVGPQQFRSSGMSAIEVIESLITAATKHKRNLDEAIAGLMPTMPADRQKPAPKMRGNASNEKIS